jgi:hypothetical protein
MAMRATEIRADKKIPEAALRAATKAHKKKGMRAKLTRVGRALVSVELLYSSCGLNSTLHYNRQGGQSTGRAPEEQDGSAGLRAGL